jgi:hypothetical protein
LRNKNYIALAERPVLVIPVSILDKVGILGFFQEDASPSYHSVVDLLTGYDYLSSFIHAYHPFTIKIFILMAEFPIRYLLFIYNKFT